MIIDDLKTVYHLVTAPAEGPSHEQRMASFYRHQAAHYDRFRDRLLQGRRELYQAIPVEKGDVLVDMGGGTGANLEFLGERLNLYDKVFIVDVSEPLLEVARQRIKARGWSNVEAVACSATEFSPGKSVETVMFSYSLSMIPNWFAAVDQAAKLLRQGGILGAVDFYVSPKFASAGRTQHGWWTRTFWPTWFARDNVHLQADHLEYLSYKFQTLSLSEQRTRLPYVPPLLGEVPYYIFTGRRI